MVEGEKRYWLHPPSSRSCGTAPKAFASVRRGKPAFAETSAFAQATARQVGEAGIAIDRFDGLCKRIFLTEESEDSKPFAPFAAFCKR